MIAISVSIIIYDARITVTHLHSTLPNLHPILQSFVHIIYISINYISLQSCLLFVFVFSFHFIYLFTVRRYSIIHFPWNRCYNLLFKVYLFSFSHTLARVSILNIIRADLSCRCINMHSDSK